MKNTEMLSSSTNLSRLSLALLTLFLLNCSFVSLGYAQPAKVEQTEGAKLVSAPVITNVTAEPKIFNADQPVKFGFRVNQAAKVSLNIYDARGYQVWSNSLKVKDGKNPQVNTDQQFIWNGKAKNNKPLLPEAYYYTLTAINKSGQTSVYDLTDITGGERIHAQNIKFDPEQKQVTYLLPSNARFFLRYGVDQGPMMGTLVNSAVQPFGQHSLPWDGKDQSQQFELSKLGQIKFGISGYTLPRNALIYQPKDQSLTTKATDWSAMPIEKSSQRASEPDRSRNVHIHRFQDRQASKDFTILLSAKSDTQKSIKVGGKQGRSEPIIVNPSTRFRVDIGPADKAIVEAQRFEVSFFVNNKLVHENEVSYVPYTWRLPELDLKPGEHILTALVVGFGSHFGVSSTKFVIEPASQ